jgi:hypothetical protein
MIVKLKALTLALVAVCAIGAIGASGASATVFHVAGMGAATGDGTQTGAATEFKIPEGALKCPNAIATIQLQNSSRVPQETTGETATITLEEPEHKPLDETLTCTFAGLAGSIVHMNGCAFVLHSTPLPIQVQVECPAGQQITVTAIVTGVTKCTIHIPAQTGKQGFTITNGAEDIVVKNASKNINYTTQAGTGLGACQATSAGTGAEFNGEVTVQGTAGGAASKLQFA